jgi:hypothetical protein
MKYLLPVCAEVASRHPAAAFGSIPATVAADAQATGNGRIMASYTGASANGWRSPSCCQPQAR